MTKRRKQTRKRPTKRRRMEEPTSSSFDPDLIRAIFKNVWAKKDLEREKNDNVDPMDCDVLLETSTCKKSKISSVNCNALKLSCELVRLFISEAVQRAAMITEAEGGSKIEATHLERILPQLLLDF